MFVVGGGAAAVAAIAAALAVALAAALAAALIPALRDAIDATIPAAPAVALAAALAAALIPALPAALAAGRARRARGQHLEHGAQADPGAEPRRPALRAPALQGNGCVRPEQAGLPDVRH